MDGALRPVIAEARVRFPDKPECFQLFVFESLYNQVLNDHAPIKHFHMRGNQVPYMTDERRKSIRFRNRLWKRFIKDQTGTMLHTIASRREIGVLH